MVEKLVVFRKDLFTYVFKGGVNSLFLYILHGEFDFSDERMVDSMGLALPKNFELELV